MKIETTLLVISFFSGAVVAAAPSEPGTVLWTFDAGSPLVSSPAISGEGTVYVSSMSGLYAVTNVDSAASNKWIFPVGISSSCPSIGLDGTIYFTGQNGNLYAVNPDGSQRWFYATQSAGTSPALGQDGTIYVQGDSGFSAVSLVGAQEWKLLPGGSGNSATPAIARDGTIYLVSSFDDKLYAYAPGGNRKWTANLASGSTGPPAIAEDGSLYVSGQIFQAFSPAGSNLWSLNIAAPLFGPPVVAGNGAIYICGPDRSLYALTTDGKVAWNAVGAFARFEHTAPAVDRSGSIYYCVSNAVWSLTPQGQVQWVVAVGAPAPNIDGATTSPAIGPDGKIYACIGTRLYAISGTNPPAENVWPMYQQNARHTGKVEKPSLQKPKKRADANFEFEVFAQLSNTFSIEASTNLADWNSLTSFVATTVPMDIADLDATNHPGRFYRAADISPPGAKRARR